MADNNYTAARDGIDRAICADTLTRAWRARLEAACLKGEKLVEEYQFGTAKALLGAGLTLIPSDNLLDHQFVVSYGVYKAAKRLCRED